jgi:hypothetical protein
LYKLECALGLLQRDFSSEAVEKLNGIYDRIEKDARTSREYTTRLIKAHLLSAQCSLMVFHVSGRTGPIDMNELGRKITEAARIAENMGAFEFEGLILACRARWHYIGGRRDLALSDVDEALEIAERSEYRLQEAEIHNLRAWFALGDGECAETIRHAECARERARCDGPPWYYKAAFEEAERLLAAVRNARTS